MSQTEKLDREDSLKKIRIIAERQVCFLCTFTDPFQQHSRPMTTKRITDKGNFLFFVKETQDMVSQIDEKNDVNLLYNTNNSFLAVRGKARIYRNQSTIDELYTPIDNAWFEGKNDPSIKLLEVEPEDAHYWDSANGKIVTLYKLAQAKVTGENAEIGVSGELTV